MSHDDARRAEILDAIFHDVRTPLTVIRLRVQMICRELDRERPIEPDRLRRQLGEVAEQVQAIQRVLDEFQQRQ